MPNYMTPLTWAPKLSTSNYIQIEENLFGVQVSSNPWALKGVDANSVRFEVRDGDTWWWDGQMGHASERAEISHRAVIKDGTPMQIAYKFTVEPGEANTARWLVLGQLHQDEYPGALPWSPPFEIKLKGERLAVVIHYNDEAGGVVEKEVFVDPLAIERGHSYDMKIRAVFSPEGDARLVVERDGVTLVDYVGPMGYLPQNGVYWKQGIYRDARATETMAVVYDDLSITTGSGNVRFPSRADFIAAPVLTLDKLVQDPAGQVATIKGTAAAGMTVTVTEDDRPIGSVVADADGRFTLTAAIGAGENRFNAVAHSPAGRSSFASNSLVVATGTAAEIKAKLPTLATVEGLAAIVITDTPMFTFASGTELSVLRNAAGSALEKIQGGYSYVISRAITGQPYDRQDEFFTSSGVLQERLRYSGDKLVYDEDIGANGYRSLKTWTATGSILNEYENGRLVAYHRSDALDRLTMKELYRADGTKETHHFDPATGFEKAYTIIHADKTRVDAQFGITGKNFTTQIVKSDAAGVMTNLTRFDAAGTKLFEEFRTPDGSREAHTYNSAGKEISFVINRPDGSRTEGLLNIVGQPHVAEHFNYDAGKRLIDRDRFDAAGRQVAEEIVNADGTRKIYGFDVQSGLRTEYKLVALDRSYSVTKFVPGDESQLLKISYYNSSGRLLSETVLQTQPDPVAAPVTPATVPPAAPVVEEAPVVPTPAPPPPVAQPVTPPEPVGIVTPPTPAVVEPVAPVTPPAVPAVRETKVVDATTGELTKLTKVYADGSSEVTKLNLKGLAYVEEQSSFTASGRLQEVKAFYGDEARTVAYKNVKNDDGSSEQRHFDKLGRETYFTKVAADGSRELVSYTYQGTSDTVHTSRHELRDSTNQSIWIDVTNPDGSHRITASKGGVTLASHEGVVDTFVSAGSDTFVFQAGNGRDVIQNFGALPGPGHDVIALDRDVVSSFENLTYYASGRDTVIALGQSDTITLKNVAPHQLTHDDFLFV